MLDRWSSVLGFEIFNLTLPNMLLFTGDKQLNLFLLAIKQKQFSLFKFHLSFRVASLLVTVKLTSIIKLQTMTAILNIDTPLQIGLLETIRQEGTRGGGVGGGKHFLIKQKGGPLEIVWEPPSVVWWMDFFIRSFFNCDLKSRVCVLIV